jgi:hypothetical protein
MRAKISREEAIQVRPFNVGGNQDQPRSLDLETRSTCQTVPSPTISPETVETRYCIVIEAEVTGQR